MKFRVFFFLLFSQFAFAQVVKTVEVDVLGRPTWQQIISIGKNGLVLFIKSDVTKAKAIRFDSDLNKLWETELFLDAEKQPTAYTVDKELITFMFSENQGMYYQVFTLNVNNGKFDYKGFELREFFQDKDYVYLGNKVLMAGQNEKGAAFYNFKFDEGFGDFLSANLEGKAQIQYFQLSEDKSKIETLWAVKESSYTNEKKKKGEFIKDAYTVYAVYDTTGQRLTSIKIASKAGSFPLTAKAIKQNEVIKAITGTYQANNGSKGIYIALIENGQNTLTNFYSYNQLLAGEPSLKDEDIKKIADSFVFFPTEPIFHNNQISIGGSFVRAEYQTISQSNGSYYDPYGRTYDPYNRYGRFGGTNTRTSSKQVFKGFNFLLGIVATFDLSGQLIRQKRIDMNHFSLQIVENLAITPQNSYAYISKGNVAVGYLNLGASPILYKLSNDKSENKNIAYIPNYQGVRYWYDNFLIADGSRLKVEPIKDDLPLNQDNKKKKKAISNPPQANIRKIIFLSKIAG
ncbi:MAG: hypothetical protein MUF45_07755 [Spirosomaceae bacterium]|nr:hypothetical protein [Spirosomataceae bacterium]